MKTANLISETYNMLGSHFQESSLEYTCNNIIEQKFIFDAYKLLLNDYIDDLNFKYHQKRFMRDDREFWIQEILRNDSHSWLVIKYVSLDTYEVGYSVLFSIPLGKTYDRP